MDTQRSAAIRTIKLMLFSASIVPVCVGGALAYDKGGFEGSVNLTHFVLLLLALFLGQAGGDYLYYYFTHYHSDDRDAHTKIFAGWRPLFVETPLPPAATVYAGFVCLALAGVIGLNFFLFEFGSAVLPFALAGGAVAIFFTPLMLRGYKEPVIFLTFGPLAMAGVYLVLTNSLSWTPALVSLPIAFLVTVVAYLKGAHITVKSMGDRQAVVDVRSSHIVVLYVLGYASLILAIVLGVAPLWTLLGLLSLPIAASVVTAVKSESGDVTQYLWAVIRSIAVLIVTGIGMCAGFLLPL